MFDVMSEGLFVALAGLAGGVLLGLAARLGRFCTLGAIEDLLYGGDSLRLRMWALAIGVAIFSTFALSGLGLVEIESSAYLSTEWSLTASLVGGFVFGYGMALAGNCGYGALARLGGGDMRAFVLVLVMGVSAYVVMSGPLAHLRLDLFPREEAIRPNGIAHALSRQFGIGSSVLGMSVGLLISLAALTGSAFWQKPSAGLWGLIVGLAITSGWAATSYANDHGFGSYQIMSHSFTAPVGESLLYAMTSHANLPSFAISAVIGVLLGAFLGSLRKGHFRWEACEDPRELKRQILGAMLMGVGAVVAMGCTIGQGISAFSTLSYSAPVTFAAIFAGVAFGLRQLIVGFQVAE